MTRESATAEGVPGGFASLYPVLRAMEDAGRIRRGFFVAGIAATQFALPGALDELRRLRMPRPSPEVVTLSAVDPACPYGAVLPWPATTVPPVAPDGTAPAARRPMRAPGAQVVLVNGSLAGWLARGGRQLLAWLPAHEPERSAVANALARALAALASAGGLLAEIDGVAVARHALALPLLEAGFVATPQGFHLRPGARAGFADARGHGPAGPLV